MVVVLGCDLIVGAGGYTLVEKDMTIPLAISLQAMATVPCSIREPICKTVDDLSSESNPGDSSFTCRQNKELLLGFVILDII